MTVHRALAAAVPLAIVLTLTGCASSNEPEAAAPSSTATLAATDYGTTPDAEPVATEPAAPVADAYSQVVNGVLYQGTESAPVKIGADAPGAAPAVESQMVVVDGKSENARQLATDADKYIVLVWNSPGEGGFVWKVRGMSQHGSFRDLADSFGLPPFASADAAVAGGFTVDGRTLDRAEYLLLLQ